MDAAKDGNLDEVMRLLGAGADPNGYKDSNENTALLWVCYKNAAKAEEIAKILIRKGADIHAVNNLEENTPLIYASSNGLKSVVSLLLSKGANAQHKNKEGKTALDVATELQQTDTIKLLKDSKLEVRVCLSLE